MEKLRLPKDSYFYTLEKNNEILNFGKPSRDIALSHVKNHRTVIDIGAHIGISVLQWSKLFKNVYAFEPMLEHYECLISNTNNLTNVECFNYALSNETSIKNAAYRTLKNSGSFQLLDDQYQQPSKKPPRQLYQVETKKLDDHNFTEIDLIKIDVEGWELEVLLGAKSTIIKNSPVLIVEFTGGNSSKSLHRYDVNLYNEFINEIGYIPVGSYDDDIIYIKG